MNKLGILFLLLSMFCIGNSAYADDTPGKDGVQTDIGKDAVSGVICNIVLTLNGPISQAIATLVIIITGYSFFVGKVSIGMLFIVAAGIMMVFGAQTIMGWIIGTDFKCNKFEVGKPTTN